MAPAKAFPASNLTPVPPGERYVWILPTSGIKLFIGSSVVIRA